jgi:hypothetical protein
VRDPGHTNLQEALKEADMSSTEVHSPSRDAAVGQVDFHHLQPPRPEVRYVFTPTPVPPG